MSEPTAKGQSGEPSLVGSDRVLAVLTELARHPAGVGLDQLARALDSSKPTVHRALGSLRRAGFAAQNGRGNYQLGDEFIRLAFANHEARPDHLRVQPTLEELAERYGETAHYAVLDGRSVVYRSKVEPNAGAVKLTSIIGGRNPAHCTAVGKLLLSYLLVDESAVAQWVAAAPLPASTPRAKVTTAELQADFELIRARGYSTDDQENEPGVNCLAVPLFLSSPTVPSGAISISALTYRTPLAKLEGDLEAILAIVGRRGARDQTSA
ncbi:IclR family transcriptional regulator [Jatrophihabitans sp. GAS493]|uniref:IclR family transcriptional regulator n=1 Tax=Jatrophihabitans sp. GAS493 TaxID=1907575 RepID=UPI000BB83069|nr:IclR family transcriptional regulator [Jatrophihabitans sp. GAS493]SOD72243.1 IclR family transcriptional regulator [Jatrophihabitans sp. GAS493]